MQLPELELNDLTPQQFLDEYWQKKPCLIRQGLPGIDFPLSAEELAGLACEPEAPARILREVGGELGWSVQHGPFEEEDFAALPESHWTLLITDLEKLLPDMQALIEPFRFVPDWRIDDLMISYAADQGSVGPHLDEYDVFLVQVQGQREWQFDTRPYTDEDYRPNPELKLLSRFEAEQTWLLDPGDILYLPPNVAHHGIAQGACMTCSIGFRAPAYNDMLNALTDYVVQQPSAQARYRDPGLKQAHHPGEIPFPVLSEIRSGLEALLKLDDARFVQWFGTYNTEPALDWIEPPDEAINAQELLIWLQAGNGLHRSTASRMAYIEQDGQLWFFADGYSWFLPQGLQTLAELLCAHYQYDAPSLLKYLEDETALQDMLLDLINQGILELELNNA